jgi:hypothetical protein
LYTEIYLFFTGHPMLIVEGSNQVPEPDPE